MPTVVAAYRDWGRLLTAMRAIILSAFLILLAISVAEEFVPKGLSEQQLSGEALGLVKDAVWAVLITPAYTLPVGEPVFRVFFGWLFALKVLVGLPFDLIGALQTLNWSPRASAL